MNLKRDLLIDACVFEMGHGASKLKLELFEKQMNENYGSDYNIESMQESMATYCTILIKRSFGDISYRYMCRRPWDAIQTM